MKTPLKAGEFPPPLFMTPSRFAVVYILVVIILIMFRL